MQNAEPQCLAHSDPVSQKGRRGPSLAVPRRRLCASSAGGAGSTPSWGTQSPRAVRPKRKKEEKRGRAGELKLQNIPVGPYLDTASAEPCNLFGIIYTRVSSSVGFPGGDSGKEPACQRRRRKRRGLDPWVGKIPWRRERLPTPRFLPGQSPWTEEPGGLQSIGSQSQTRLKQFSTHETQVNPC